MDTPHQPFVGFAMLFAMVLPEPYHWLLVHFDAFLEHDFNLVLTLIAFHLVFRFAKHHLRSSIMSTSIQQTADVSLPDTQDYAAEVANTGGYAKDGQGYPSTREIEALLHHIVQDTRHPLRQTMDEFIRQGITSEMRVSKDETMKLLGDELAAAKAELSTAQSQLAAVTNELSTFKAEYATSNTTVAPPQDQIREIREQIRGELLTRLRKDVVGDILTLREEVKTQRSRLTNALVAVGEMEGDFPAIHRQLAKQADKIFGLDNSVGSIVQMDEKTAELQSHIDDLKAALAEQGSFPEQIEDLQHRTKSLEDDTEEHKSQLEELKRASANLESLNLHMDELRVVIPDMRSKLDSAIQDVKKHKGRLLKDRKELRKHSRLLTQDDHSPRGREGRVSPGESSAGIEAPQRNSGAEEAGSTALEADTSSDVGQVVNAPVAEDQRSASPVPVECAEEEAAAPRLHVEEDSLPAPSTEDLQAPPPVFNFVLPEGGRAPEIPRRFNAAHFSTLTFDFGPTLEPAVSPPRFLKACRPSSRNTAVCPDISGLLPASSSVDVAPPQDSATTSSPLSGASYDAVESTGLQYEHDAMDLDDLEDYDQTGISDDQDEAEEMMATMGYERPETPSSGEFAEGSDRDAEGEDDDDEYGYTCTFEYDPMVIGE